MGKKAFIALAGLFLLALPAAAQINLLHEFAGGGNDGAQPFGSLVLSGSTFYGLTNTGGDYDVGTIFKIETNGPGLTLLHEFAGGTADGAFPRGSLILSGTTLYGMTQYGGDSDLGTVFKIQTDGSNFTLLYEFVGGHENSEEPLGSLILSGSTLYGMTQYGGLNNGGTIFKVQINGSGFALVAGKYSSLSSWPYGSLIISGTTLYGMLSSTTYGPAGRVFKVETNGSNFVTLHEFNRNADNGATPHGDLILSGTTLYGMTKYGGDNDFGTIFKVETNGTNFTLLHEFAGSVADGKNPYGSLILSGSTLFGMTCYGGDNDSGTIFKIETNGANFALLHEFAGGTADGKTPYGSLILSGSTLFGMTCNGGDNDSGVIFSMPAAALVDLVGTWDGQGVFFRNSGTGVWKPLAAPADLIACGDLGGDGLADLAGIWSGQAGVWTRDSASGAWNYLGSAARHIGAGDMNGDGREDFLGTWDSQGVFYRNSISGAWTMMATPATLIAAGDLDGDGKDDLVGIWPSQAGVWVKYSQSGNWAYLGSAVTDLTTGDMNGDGRADLVGTWAGQGVFYRNSLTGAWVMMATPASQVTAGDLDGDGTDDLIGIWAGQAGVWVKYSQTQIWAYIGASARDIDTGKFAGGGWSANSTAILELETPTGKVLDGPAGAPPNEISDATPGGRFFNYQAEENLKPQELKRSFTRIPGPGEPGFRPTNQPNLFPGMGGNERKSGYR
jgi:uncharacterized repeat protein (TIGR03803 family)